MNESPTEIENTENNTKNKNKKKTNKQEKSEKIIQKWLKLQKIIKEEITLEEVISKQQLDDFEFLKRYFIEYYGTKLASRKEFEDIKKLSKNLIFDDKKIVIEKDMDRILLDNNEPVKNLMFLFRDNYDYITKLVSLIEETDKSENVESLVELFCNQFYDNILIPNPEQEELLLLIYKLLEEEITPMDSASIDEFLDDSSFVGKFISSYMKRHEIKVYLNLLLNPVIISIENQGKKCLDMSLINIYNDIKEQNKFSNFANNKKRNSDKYETNLFKRIPRTSIYFKNKNVLENEKEIQSNENLTISSFLNNNNSEELNPEYDGELTQDKIIEKIRNEEKNEMKDFYLYQLEQITDDQDLFTNVGLRQVLNDPYFQDNKIAIIDKYKKNFLYIKDRIDNLLQSLIDKITTIPYTVRCICKVISLLMNKRFPLLPKYLKNSFIGKFIFDKCIFPVLGLENKNVIDSRIFSLSTKKCLDVIINVISNANRCILYNTNTDTEKTIFNYYLIEIIPLLNEFYEKLMDIKLPKALDLLMENVILKIEKNEENKISRFQRKNMKKKNIITQQIEQKKEIIKIEKEISYDYFKENSDEILHLESICFSLEDVLFIIKLIERNTKLFENMPKYNLFIKSYERIKSSEYQLEQKVKNNPGGRRFFIVFKDEKNNQLDKILNKMKNKMPSFFSGNQDSELILKCIKFCIKTILNGFNLLNNKDYSYLNNAVTSNKFFSAIRHTLDDQGEFSENHNKIPLVWYGQYINNNKRALDKTYKENDFEKLYNEIYNDECNLLNELKSFSSTIIARDGMNLRCAEKLLDKAKYDLEDIVEAKKFLKIEKFIDTEKIEVCIQINKNIEDKNLPEKDIPPKINIINIEECNLQEAGHHMENGKKKASSHAIYIKDFINFFSEDPWDGDTYNKNEKPKEFVIQDILNGNRKNKIYKTMKMYMEIVKNKIKNPIINVGLFNDKDNCNEISEKIEDHILRQIYNNVFPKSFGKDEIFYSKTEQLENIKPDQLEIKKIYSNQLGVAISRISKIDEGKSVMDKLNYIMDAHSSINNIIKFSSGKNDDSGQDETTPLFNYVVLKAKPKRMYSNINYIKCFLQDSDLSDYKGFLLSQIESSTSFVEELYESRKKT